MSAELKEVAEVRNHWWPRQGWYPGRQVYTWHLVFEHGSELRRLVSSYHAALENLPGLNLIPSRWLHLTIQGVGFADVLTDRQIDRVVEAVTVRVEAIPRFSLTFERAIVIGEAIVLPPAPVDPLNQLWRAIRSGINDAMGAEAVPMAHEQSGEFRPHVSIAYVNTDGPAAPYRDALATVDVKPISTPITDVALILQDRILAPDWVYRWTTKNHAALR
jgi:2'-5' RNA ligase